MPRIDFYENDNTGSSATAALAGVFIPGDIAIADGVKPDAFGCVTIPAYTTDVSEYLKRDTSTPLYEKDSRMSAYHMVEMLSSLGYAVIYKYIKAPFKVQEAKYSPVAAGTVTPDNYNQYFVQVDDTFEPAQSYDAEGTTQYFNRTFEYVPTYESAPETKYVPVTVADEEAFKANTFYVKTVTDAQRSRSRLARSTDEYTVATTYDSSTPYFIKVTTKASPLKDVDWSFLLDKNAYDVKFLTAGPFGSVTVTEGTYQGTQKYLFDFSVLNSMNQSVAGVRKDCVVVADLNYDEIKESLGNNGNLLAQDYKTALEFENVDGQASTGITVTDETFSTGAYRFAVDGSTDANGLIDISSRAFTILPNAEMSYTENGMVYTINVPMSIVYLYQYATVSRRASQWLPMAGVNRGVIDTSFTPDLSISKYVMDNDIITDGAGISFDAIVNVSSYGNTIWGDRTLLRQVGTRNIQATSYLSIRNLVSDIAKIAYANAIRYTYETNNDVTWLNFKAGIVTMLDQVVGSGVIQTYKIKRVQPIRSDSRNTMAAQITIYTQLPVENFEITVNLEDAEVTVSTDEQ